MRQVTRMTRTTRFAATAAAVLTLFLGLALAAHAKDKDKDDDANKVTIKKTAYNPASIKIKKGETVTWVNEDDKDHTVISDDPKKEDFHSDNLGNGDTFSHKFEKAGKFPYHCKYHPRMKGLVTVSD